MRTAAAAVTPMATAGTDGGRHAGCGAGLRLGGRGWVGGAVGGLVCIRTLCGLLQGGPHSEGGGGGGGGG